MIFSIMGVFTINGQNLIRNWSGQWTFETFDRTTKMSIYHKSSKTNKKARGYTFETDGKLTVRTDGAGCHVLQTNGKKVTFPLGEYIGTWLQLNDSTIRLRYETFIGLHTEDASLRQDKLYIRTVSSH